MRYALLLLATLAISTPALAGKGNGFSGNPANQQSMLDKVRAAPTGAPSFTQAAKDHIVSVIKKNCPTCN